MKCRKCSKDIPNDALYCPYCAVKQATSHEKKKRGNGQGTIIKLSNGKYKAVVTLYYFLDDNGKLHRKTATKTCDKKKEAIEMIPKLLNAGMTSHDTILDISKLYFDSSAYKSLSKNRLLSIKTAWKRLEPIYNCPIVSLTLDQMQNLVDRITNANGSATTVKHLLTRFYDLAVKREIVQSNKAINIELPSGKPTERQPFNREEIDKLWEDWNASQSYAGIILLMIYTGMRRNEMLNIRRDNIHLEEQYMIGGEKTESGKNREIVFPVKLVQIIGHYLKNGGDKPFYVSQDTFYKRYYGVLERLEIRPLPPHSCRHTFFTLAVDSGADSILVAEMGGHADISMTKHYTHTPVEVKRKLVENL